MFISSWSRHRHLNPYDSLSMYLGISIKTAWDVAIQSVLLYITRYVESKLHENLSSLLNIFFGFVWSVRDLYATEIFLISVCKMRFAVLLRAE